MPPTTRDGGGGCLDIQCHPGVRSIRIHILRKRLRACNGQHLCLGVVICDSGCGIRLCWFACMLPNSVPNIQHAGCHDWRLYLVVGVRWTFATLDMTCLHHVVQQQNALQQKYRGWCCPPIRRYASTIQSQTNTIANSCCIIFGDCGVVSDLGVFC